MEIREQEYPLTAVTQGRGIADYGDANAADPFGTFQLPVMSFLQNGGMVINLSNFYFFAKFPSDCISGWFVHVRYYFPLPFAENYGTSCAQALGC